MASLCDQAITIWRLADATSIAAALRYHARPVQPATPNDHEGKDDELNDGTVGRHAQAAPRKRVFPYEYSSPAREPFRNARRGGQRELTRRGFLSAGATAAGLVVSGCAGPAAPARRLQLTLAPPTGSYPIGTVALHLVDHSRRDPWLPGARPRELMVSVWYPAQHADRYPWAPWMPPAAGRLFLAQLIPVPPTIRHSRPSPVPLVPLDGVRLPVTRARQRAPVNLPARRCPVVLYSPGYEDDRELGTGLVSDLASRGYIVVTIDHTYEAAEVEFPGGRVEVSRQPNTQAAIYKAATVRVADTRFVLDELAALNSGLNPDAEHHPLPAGLAGALDLARTGMFGHSLGGATAAAAMAADPRILAGIDLDGSITPAAMPSDLTPTSPQLASLAGGVARRLGDRPFMMMSSKGHTLDNDPTWAAFWPHLSGWRLALSLKNSGHYSYTDEEEFLRQLVTAGIISPSVDRQVVIPTIGTIDPDRAIATERAYIGAFFDLHLEHRGGTLLARPSLRYPQVQFLAS